MNYIEKSEQQIAKVIKIPAMVYSRVSGYYNPVLNFNKGKAEEFRERVNLKVPEKDAIP